mgnify:CR=1 FL=1
MDLSERMIVEYMAPHIVITQTVFDQITRYNMVLKVDYLIVSNGMQHYCCRMDYEHQSYTFLQDITDYLSLINNLLYSPFKNSLAVKNKIASLS